MRERCARTMFTLLASALIIGPSAAQEEIDNCLGVTNVEQDDTDRDDCGNLCDADYNQNGVVDFSDFGEFVENFGCYDGNHSQGCKCGNAAYPNQSCEEFKHLEPIPGGTVGFGDFGFFVDNFRAEPGPSGTTIGTVACP